MSAFGVSCIVCFSDVKGAQHSCIQYHLGMGNYFNGFPITRIYNQTAGHHHSGWMNRKFRCSDLAARCLKVEAPKCGSYWTSLRMMHCFSLYYARLYYFYSDYGAIWDPAIIYRYSSSTPSIVSRNLF